MVRTHLTFECQQMLDEIIHSQGFQKHRYPIQSCLQVLITNTHRKLDARGLINRKYEQTKSSAP